MLPNRWDPVRDLSTLQREFDDLFQRVFGLARERGGSQGSVAVPAVNSYVKDGILHLEAELPGVDAGQLDVRIEGQEVVIRAERRGGRTEERADFLLHECRVASFERRLPLPDAADSDRAEAVYRDGLLEITMPMTATRAGGRKLAIAGLDSGKHSQEVH